MDLPLVSMLAVKGLVSLSFPLESVEAKRLATDSLGVVRTEGDVMGRLLKPKDVATPLVARELFFLIGPLCLWLSSGLWCNLECFFLDGLL